MYSKLRYILSGRDLGLAWLFLLLMGMGALLEVLGIGLRTLSGKLRTYGYAPREKDFAKAS